ncbi:MAG: hypothetical protein HOP19_16250 [Acidobacteria bacterium]|nr:hypothetical protein [Acidobacteriota bacterium]
MQEFEQSKTVNALSDQVFSFLSDVNNLPQYLPTVRHAEHAGEDRIQIEGQAPGKEYKDTGFFRVDKAKQRMEWGSDGESSYQGWLQVKQTGGKSCEVTVHLSFDPQTPAWQAMDEQDGGREQAINEGLEKALQSIKNLCEGRGGKVESARQRKSTQ